MKEKVIIFEFFKETQGTRRYKEIVPENEEPVIRDLYIRKSFLKDQKPERITIVLRFEEEDKVL